MIVIRLRKSFELPEPTLPSSNTCCLSITWAIASFCVWAKLNILPKKLNGFKILIIISTKFIIAVSTPNDSLANSTANVFSISSFAICSSHICCWIALAASLSNTYDNPLSSMYLLTCCIFNCSAVVVVSPDARCAIFSSKEAVFTLIFWIAFAR